MRKADDIKQTIKNTKIKTNPAVNRHVLNDLIEKFDTSGQDKRNASLPSLWRTIMKRTTTKYAAAAILFVAALVFMQIISTPQAFAIEQTAQAIGSLETLHVAGIHMDENGRISDVEIWAKAHSLAKERSGDFREEVKGKRVSVVSEDENVTWRYYPEKNQMYILPGLQSSVKPFWPDGNFFLELKENAREWQEVSGKDENGNDCVVVTCSYVLERLPNRKFDFRFQFNTETMLPVRMKIRDFSTTRPPQEYQFDVIEFNQVLPENIFVFDIPEGVEIIDQR